MGIRGSAGSLAGATPATAVVTERSTCGGRGTLHASTPAAGDLSRDVDGADSFSGQYHNVRAENLAATGLRRR